MRSEDDSRILSRKKLLASGVINKNRLQEKNRSLGWEGGKKIGWYIASISGILASLLFMSIAGINH